jgi:hypothetical protein
MISWIVIAGVSATVGLVSAVLLKGRYATPIAAAVAWFSMLAYWLNEYVLPYRGGGASMWPIAQLFTGTVTAVIAGGTCLVVRAIRKP